jgi:hypothetical protein
VVTPQHCSHPPLKAVNVNPMAELHSDMARIALKIVDLIGVDRAVK